MLKFIVYDICTRFEKYGTDTRRTLINMYISMYCWTVLAFLFLVHLPETVRFIYGPFSEMFCNLHLIIRYSIINLFLLIANASIFTKYIFIFWLKNPGVFNEEFWYLFSWIYLPGIALLFQGTTFFLASLPPITFYICSGKDPGESYKSLSKYDGKFEVLTLLTIIFHLFVYLRIYIFKRKSKSIFPPSTWTWRFWKISIQHFVLLSKSHFSGCCNSTSHYFFYGEKKLRESFHWWI